MNKTKKHQKRIRNAFFIWSMVVVLIAWKMYILGEPTAEALIFTVLMMTLPVLLPIMLVRATKCLISYCIIRKNLDSVEYRMYRMMATSSYTCLSEYPDQDKVMKAKEKIRQMYSNHTWMKRYDARIIKDY